MSIFYSAEYENLTTKILKNVKVPVVINAVEQTTFGKAELIVSSNLVFIFGRYKIGRVLNESFWNADTLFLLVYEEETEMEKEFPDFWKYKILNVFGVLSKGEKTVVYSYHPYVDGTCGMGKPFIVNECFNGHITHIQSHFVQKFRNLNGCPVNVTVADIRPNVIFRGKCGVDSLFRIEGFEAGLINELSHKMNFKTVYQCFPEGVGWLKPFPGGAIGSVFKGESEFALGLLGPAMERFYYLALSTHYNVDECLIFGVQKGAGLQNTTVFELLEFEFDKWTWLLTFTVLLLVFIYFQLSLIYLKEKWLLNKAELAITLYSILMGLSVQNPKYNSQRLSLICWVIFSLIMTVAYKASMGSKLTVPGQVPDINTFEELLQSNLELTGPKSIYRFLSFSDDKDPIVLGMRRRFVVRNIETVEAVHLIAKKQKIAYLGHKSTFLYSALINPVAKGKVHVIKKCLVSYHPSVVTRKNSFFGRGLNEMIIKLEEAGIGDFWRSEYVYSIKTPPPPFVQITIDRLYGLFWILGFGYTLSIFSFVIEIYFGFCHQKNFLLFERDRNEQLEVERRSSGKTEQIEVKESKKERTVIEALSTALKILGRLKTAVWYPTEKEDVVSDVLKMVNVPVVLNAVEHPKKIGLEKRVASEVVIIFDKVNVDQILNETLWDRDTRFLVVANELMNVEIDFQIFWNYKVVNVFELLKDEEDVNVYAYLPYQNENCALTNPEIVDKYESNLENFASNGDAFKDGMRIKNMNGCPVNITIVDVKPNVMFYDECGCNATTNMQGIEGNLMTEVAKKLNFSATFVIALDGIGWGWIYPSPHGAVGEVFTQRSDFAIGLLAPTLERFENLDLSLPYNGEECITYGVPTGAGASTPNWITMLISEFNPTNWILISFSFFVVVIFFELVNKFSPVKWMLHKADVILFAFSSCLGLPVKVPKHLILRLSVTFWVLFSFVITVAYKSSMGSKLAVPSKNPDINTFQELLDSQLELTGYNNMLRLILYNDKEAVLQKMIDKFKVTNFDIDYAVDRIAAERKIAYVRHTTTFMYYAFINPKAKGHIHIIRDCIYLYHPMVVAKKNSPFTNRLNQLIARLMESGITKKWRSDYIQNLPQPDMPFLKLSLDHMYGVFCILGSGYVLGFLTLLGEIIYFRFKKKLNLR